MEIQIVIINKFGEFKGEKLKVTKEQYETIATMSSEYYKEGFEMVCDDGSFLIIPPELIKKSIYKINHV